MRPRLDVLCGRRLQRLAFLLHEHQKCVISTSTSIKQSTNPIIGGIYHHMLVQFLSSNCSIQVKAFPGSTILPPKFVNDKLDYIM